MGSSKKAKNDTKSVPKDKKRAVPSNSPSFNQLSSLPAHLAEVTWRVALPILIFALGGNYLDNKLDTRPIYSLIGLFLALFFASLLVYRHINKAFPGAFRRNK